MQIFTNISKFLVLAVLSCSLTIVWDANNTPILSPGSTYTDKSSRMMPADPIWGGITTEFKLDNPISSPQVKVAGLQSNGSDKTPSVETTDSIWDTLSNEFKLDHNAQSSEVQDEIRQLQADKGKLYRILEAAGPYIYFIHKQTQARGLPAEIALIPVIESEFNPNDHSNKGATGLWQLMPQTAQELGVKVRSGYDGRRDVIASTKAALAYFRDLGKYFNGNWYLAIAAYNCGQGKVESATRNAGSDSFWNLSLPQETRHYVPKLLAVAAIVKNPSKYGVRLPPIFDKPYFAEVKVKNPVNLAQVAKTTGVSIKTMHTLNPDYNNGMVSKKGGYTLLIPINKVPNLKDQLTTEPLPS